jgi:hypothetical protein
MSIFENGVKTQRLKSMLICNSCRCKRDSIITCANFVFVKRISKSDVALQAKKDNYDSRFPFGIGFSQP